MKWFINQLLNIVKDILSTSDDEIRYDFEDEIIYEENE